MSLDARLSMLWIRLQGRFKAPHVIIKEIPRILESIQPVTNVDVLLQQPRIKTKAVTVTGAGYYDFGKIEDMVPVATNKRYTLVGYSLTRTGVYTVTQLHLLDVPTAVELIIDNFTAATSRYLIFPTPIPIDLNWILSATVDAYTSTGALTLNVLVIEEDAY